MRHILRPSYYFTRHNPLSMYKCCTLAMHVMEWWSTTPTIRIQIMPLYTTCVIFRSSNSESSSVWDDPHSQRRRSLSEWDSTWTKTSVLVLPEANSNGSRCCWVEVSGQNYEWMRKKTLTDLVFSEGGIGLEKRTLEARRESSWLVLIHPRREFKLLRSDTVNTLHRGRLKMRCLDATC